MSTVLVAGIGNMFRGDDAFGLEVARRLAVTALPPGVTACDYGIRALHLAYALLEPVDLVIIVDAVSRGEAPGTVFLIEPDALEESGALADPHGLTLSTVFALVRALGGTMPPVLIVGCEPAELGETMGLSEPVSAAIETAMWMVQDVLAGALSATISEGRVDHEHPETP